MNEGSLEKEQHMQGAIECPACGSVYTPDQAKPNCVNCGAELPLLIPAAGAGRKRTYIGVLSSLKPLADLVVPYLKREEMLQDAGGPSLKDRVEGHVICGWCGRRYDARPESPNCKSCGGVLRLPMGSEPGPSPPRPPRNLPKGFVFNLYVKQNIGGIVGLVCMIISLPLLLIPLIGIPLFLFGLIVAYSNFATANRRRIALSQGVGVLGKIESVQRIGDKDAQAHGSVLYQVYYRFDVGDVPVQGMNYSYDPAITNHFIGQPIWVVYVPRRPKFHSIWPPLA